MIHYPCENVDCIFCAIHCPYCGQWPIVLEVEDRRMRCPTCGAEEYLVHPETILSTHLSVQALSGRSIPEWKAKARQLSPRFHHRWRSALQYLDPATSAALSRMHDLRRVYGAGGQIPFDDELYLIRGRAARRFFLRYLAAHPNASPVGAGTTAYLDDWF
jgi:hypothetical protein